MSALEPFYLTGLDGKRVRGDCTVGKDRQILFITGFLSKRWGNKSKALAQWCEEKGWGFCCYDVRGFGESEGIFTDYTLSDWIADARLVLHMLQDGPPITIVGNSFGGWIAWMMSQECAAVEQLLLIAPAFDAIGVRAREIPAERRTRWRETGWMPWDDDPLHKDWPLSWKWVEESEAYWSKKFSRLRPVKTTLLHGLQDRTILPRTSWQFVDELLARNADFPIELILKVGDHRLSSPEHLDTIRRLVFDSRERRD
jgi:pimeloyl-ACP methyl ester carboxylesterase